MKRLRGLAIATLAVNVVVILLGALVRATGSGAGCGSSWPTCNGTIIPEFQGATAIEFTHRLSSGVALILVFALVWLIFRRSERGDPVRIGATISGISIVIEALIGAVIVLAEWVADDASVARAVSVPIHLISTNVLLGGLVMTLFWVRGGGPVRLRDHLPTSRTWGLIALGLVAIGGTGAVTALADTLFPKEFSVAGIFDAEGTEHFLTQLRVVHPVVAVLIGALAARWAAARAGALTGNARRAALMVVTLVVVAALLGGLNVILLTPVWLSLLHLLVAAELWMAWVWLGAELFSQPAGDRRGDGV
jgi:heme A synthase